MSLGVVISVILPILTAAVKKQFPSPQFSLDQSTSLWLVAKPYLLIGAFSIVVGALIALVMPQASVQLAVLAGYAWDKTLQTLRDGGNNPAVS